MSDPHRFRFSISLPFDCPREEEVVRGIIETVGSMTRDGAKARSFATPHADGWVSMTDAMKAFDGLVGPIYVAHIEVGSREFDIHLVMTDVTEEEPVPASAPDAYRVWHVPSGMLN